MRSLAPRQPVEFQLVRNPLFRVPPGRLTRALRPLAGDLAAIGKPFICPNDPDPIPFGRAMPLAKHSRGKKASAPETSLRPSVACRK